MALACSMTLNLRRLFKRKSKGAPRPLISPPLIDLVKVIHEIRENSMAERSITHDDLMNRHEATDKQYAAGDVQDVLSARQKTHGEFTDNARVMQALKYVIRSERTWDDMTPVQKEALDMILHKVGRIVTGNSDEPDHWLDIEGYARLVRERL
jgi:hypothetical protein